MIFFVLVAFETILVFVSFLTHRAHISQFNAAGLAVSSGLMHATFR